MAVTIKSPREIELMREAGRILAKTHEELAKNLRPGMSTWDIDHMGEEIIRSYGLHSLVQKLQRLSRIDLRLCQ